MEQQDRRISGWKAIAAHFGRDRSTVIRWAQERGLPVRYMPGGGSKRTVFALAAELDAWALKTSLEDEAVAPLAPAEPPAPPRRRRWPAFAAGLAALLAIAAVAVRLAWPSGGAIEMPRDPGTAALYVQPRDHWARRDAPNLARSIAELEAVTRADPDFVPAHAALADAYLLAREFGSVPDALAFGRARHAAERARARAGPRVGAPRDRVRGLLVGA